LVGIPQLEIRSSALESSQEFNLTSYFFVEITTQLESRKIKKRTRRIFFTEIPPE
jgi:hypothetical protein